MNKQINNRKHYVEISFQSDMNAKLTVTNCFSFLKTLNMTLNKNEKYFNDSSEV